MYLAQRLSRQKQLQTKTPSMLSSSRTSATGGLVGGGTGSHRRQPE